MLHEEMADYFDFLNLHGFKRQQEYHFFDESAELRGIHRYAINHCNRLITDTDIPSVKAIPQGWYNYTRLQVDEELKYLTREMLEYKAVDYDMDYIMFKQNEIHECYKEKQKEIGINIC